jgi:hypothetical protein
MVFEVFQKLFIVLSNYELLLVDVSSVGHSLAAGKMRLTHMSQAAFGIILQYHRWLPVCIFRVKSRVSDEGY